MQCQLNVLDLGIPVFAQDGPKKLQDDPEMDQDGPKMSGPYDVLVVALLDPRHPVPYPSLSFGEYNSRRGSFFTPLVYFLAGHYLDP